MGRKALREVACIAKPDTILAWYRRLVAKKFDGPNTERYPGRPTVEPDVEALVVRMARENTGWGYDRIVGALANLGHRWSNQTEGNILRGHGIAPAPKRSQTTSWKDFISAHINVLAGADFFSVEVLSWRGLVTDYVLFFILLVNRRVSVADIFSSACCASSRFHSARRVQCVRTHRWSFANHRVGLPTPIADILIHCFPVAPEVSALAMAPPLPPLRSEGS